LAAYYSSISSPFLQKLHLENSQKFTYFTKLLRLFLHCLLIPFALSSLIGFFSFLAVAGPNYQGKILLSNFMQLFYSIIIFFAGEISVISSFFFFYLNS